MKLLFLFLLLFSTAGCSHVSISQSPVAQDQEEVVLEKEAIEKPIQVVEEKPEPRFSLHSYIILDEVNRGELSAYLTTKKTEAVLAYWNSFSDKQIQREAFTCLESGVAYDENLFPLELIILASGKLASQHEFSPREKLSAPFTCFSLVSISNDSEIIIQTRTADGLSQSNTTYLWNIKTDELIQQ